MSSTFEASKSINIFYTARGRDVNPKFPMSRMTTLNLQHEYIPILNLSWYQVLIQNELKKVGQSIDCQICFFLWNDKNKI